MLTSEVRPAEARFELTLAFHCAPALAGIKPADLIALPGEGDETDALLASYSAALAGAGISLRPLCRCRSRCLVLVYRRDRLERQLEQEEVARLLERDGYPLAGGLEAMLDHLASRMAGSGGFPHEVGLFLSYPPEDVQGFIDHRAMDFKCAGLWKVYGDQQRAQALFDRFRRCTQRYCALWQTGLRLEQLAVAV